MRTSVGLDFGTTNSALAVADRERRVTLERFGRTGADSLRSILYFHPDRRGPRGVPEPVVGPEAIDRYLESDGDGRLLQSFKSHLASRSFQATGVFGRNFTLEALIAAFLKVLRARQPAARRVVVGRPVRFAHADSAVDDDFAVGRLRGALAEAGFDDVVFELEPIAAAWHYEARLTRDERVLIADFGGGTSDFCLLTVGPSFRGAGRAARGQSILGTEGVALAGDAFDAQIVLHAVAPALGKGSMVRSYMEKDPDKVLPVPPWIYGKLARWHTLSFLKSPETLRFIAETRAQSLEPDKIAALEHVIDADLGYRLYQAVERVKRTLSTADSAELALEDGPLKLKKRVTRKQFEGWIGDELGRIEAAVERLLASTGVAASSVDRVFMTDGSSLMPAMRRLFEKRFGAAKLAGQKNDELTSMAQGLALAGLDQGSW